MSYWAQKAATSRKAAEMARRAGAQKTAAWYERNAIKFDKRAMEDEETAALAAYVAEGLGEQ